MFWFMECGAALGRYGFDKHYSRRGWLSTGAVAGAGVGGRAASAVNLAKQNATGPLSRLLVGLLVGSLAGLLGGCTRSAPVTELYPPEAPAQTAPVLPTEPDPPLAENVAEGVILHAWSWSFNTIKDNLADIAAAGYSAIQVSPIQEALEGHNGGMQIGDTPTSQGDGSWYFLYQPLSWEIGNYVLGTEAEFVEMAAAAEELGIKIIVDVVVNHMTAYQQEIQPSVADIPEVFHERCDVGLWFSRENVTQCYLLGLVDLRTGNPLVQEGLIAMLERIIADGGDGFRFDAGKHIELPAEITPEVAPLMEELGLPAEIPGDDPSFATDFWPVITKVAGDRGLFQYNEVLQDNFTPFAPYAAFMPVTASAHGQIVRTAAAGGTFGTGLFQNFQSEGVPPEGLVFWVESHDNYAHDGSATQLTEDDIALGWAVLAARGAGTPLFFSRPNNSSPDNVWGDNVLGARGSAAFMAPKVAEVNKFRNAMIGTGERITNAENLRTVALIERGAGLTAETGVAAGAVILNGSPNQTNLTAAETALPDGTYIDRVAGGTFTVTDGLLAGTLAPRSVTVLR